jgi:diacylglycerol kinase family enzyme
MGAYRRCAEEVLSAHGHQATFDIVRSGEIVEALEKAGRKRGIDAVIAGGGDGTISCAARIAWKSGMPLGIIPAGTMNLFARSLRLPLDLDAVLQALAEAEIAAVDISSVNGRGFIHQFSIGLHPRMVRFRNRYEYASRLGKIRASTRAAIDVIFDPPSFAVDAEIDGRSERAMVSMISVSNNPFGSDPLMFQDRVDTGRLGYYSAPPLPPSGVARLALDILSGRRGRNPDLTERSASTVALRFPRYREGANMILDGELLPLLREVDISIHPGALMVLRPTAVL